MATSTIESGLLTHPMTQELTSALDQPRERTTSSSPKRTSRRPLPTVPTEPMGQADGSPLSPLNINAPQPVHPRSPVRAASFETGDDTFLRRPSGAQQEWTSRLQKSSENTENPGRPVAKTQSIPYRQVITAESSRDIQQPQFAVIERVDDEELGNPPRHPTHDSLAHPRKSPQRSSTDVSGDAVLAPSLQHSSQHLDQEPSLTASNRGIRPPNPSRTSVSSPSMLYQDRTAALGQQLNQHLSLPRNTRTGSAGSRPPSVYSSASEQAVQARTRSPQLSPSHHDRAPSANSGRSVESRPVSYIDLLNVPYPQPPPAPANLDNAHLRTAVGNHASLLSTKQTLDMYRANVKKTNDPAIQYEFAIFMINTAQEAGNAGQANNESQKPSSSNSRRESSPVGSQTDLLREARHILQRLSDRSYPFAQYYLADGYASGLFNKGVEDYDRAFPLFVSASKHGHAEAGYRAALCYEFGWGTRKDPQKAVQFNRQSASKNHPGAMTRLGKACLVGDMGLGYRYREGVKWLKRAAESADFQYNSAPYELGLLHETGFGDDIFQDKSYAAQLFTQSADLGHVEANYLLGDAYEHGKLGCPRDPALSVHFYTGAAQRDHPLAMMALCAWYMVGAEPVLEKDENEAYEWAKKAAELGEPSHLTPQGFVPLDLRLTE